MAVEVTRHGRAEAAEVIAALTAWAPRHAAVLGLHPGDVGWHLRHDDDVLDDSLVVVRDAGEPVAAGVAESGAFRPVICPGRWDDDAVAAALGEVSTELAGAGQVYSDAASHTAYRAWLSARGWTVDPETWVVLYRPLSAHDAAPQGIHTTTLETAADIADRVAVQRSAFEGSTFTVDRWHLMAAGPGFDRRFDLLRRDSAGTAVAAATGWMAGPGKTAILEPVGTHRDHQGLGHGQAVSEAVIAALSAAGASGVAVQTPQSNTSAVRTYEKCGMHIVELLHALVSPEPS